MDNYFNYYFRMKYIEKLKSEYHKLDRQSKKDALDMAVKILGYNRKYLISLLNNFKSRDEYKICGRGRKQEYLLIKPIIIDLWEQFGCIWSKRLKVVIAENMSWITQKYQLTDIQIKLLNSISYSTIDRILKAQRIRRKKYLFSRTRPGSLLRREIPVIIEVSNDITKPGHIQIDLVAHCGESISGDFCWSLNATDIYSQWSETECIINKSEYEVINALKNIISRMPFDIISINSDNGSEFINWELLRYCKNSNILFTRARPYKKDDNAYIEQKNWTNVRKLIGWDRYEGEKAKELLNGLYRDELRLFLNLFMPSVKRIETKKKGSRYTRIYDSPKTPLTRLYEYDNNSKITNYINLKHQINPFELIEKINTKLDEIWKNRSKKVMKDRNYLKQQQKLKEIEKLLKKEVIYG